MGVSDPAYFAWLRSALERFERQDGALADLGRKQATPDLWGLGEQGATPPIAWLAGVLGKGTRVTVFDRFPSAPGVRRQDINDLGVLPDAACDVITVFRASMFVSQPAVFLAHLGRLLRPGGLALVDWLHGLSDAPVLDLHGDPRHAGRSTPFLTTYADPVFLAEFPAEFGAFVRHVNRPPWGANVRCPGVPLGLAERLRRLAGGGPRRAVSLATYLDTLRADLGRAGRRLVEPALLEQHFKIVFRDARYLHGQTGKFNLYLLTVLQPVGRGGRVDLNGHAWQP